MFVFFGKDSVTIQTVCGISRAQSYTLLYYNKALIIPGCMSSSSRAPPGCCPTPSTPAPPQTRGRRRRWGSGASQSGSSSISDRTQRGACRVGENENIMVSVMSGGFVVIYKLQERQLGISQGATWLYYYITYIDNFGTHYKYVIPPTHPH